MASALGYPAQYRGYRVGSTPNHAHLDLVYPPNPSGQQRNVNHGSAHDWNYDPYKCWVKMCGGEMAVRHMHIDVIAALDARTCLTVRVMHQRHEARVAELNAKLRQAFPLI